MSNMVTVSVKEWNEHSSARHKLSKRIAELETEVARLTKHHGEMHEQRNEDWQELAKAEAEVARLLSRESALCEQIDAEARNSYESTQSLEAALRRYAEHDGTCEPTNVGWCACGLSTALSPQELPEDSGCTDCGGVTGHLPSCSAPEDRGSTLAEPPTPAQEHGYLAKYASLFRPTPAQEPADHHLDARGQCRRRQSKSPAQEPKCEDCGGAGQVQDIYAAKVYYPAYVPCPRCTGGD